MPTPTLTFEQRITCMQAEIVADVRAGRIPVDCPSFSSLHDHVDANEYGLFFEDNDIDVELANKCQNAIDQWIRDGSMRLRCETDPFVTQQA